MSRTREVEKDKRDTVYEVHLEVIKLADEFKVVIESFFKKESELLSNNEKFLVVNRAVSWHSKAWFEHYCREMNPELKNIKDAE